MNIHLATESDFQAIWPIFQAVIATETTYVFAPTTSYKEAFSYWFGPKIKSFVVEDNQKIVGMYKLIENQPGLGSHVANASFMVDPNYSAKGLGKTMGIHCLKEAKKMGFLAMQFNFVVSSNLPAVSLWQKLGFNIVGTLPKAFKHKVLGYVDVFVMYRFLDDIEI
ncbi:MAG: GNAT family N-acetyltransferase [Blastocatellia bacterium]|nr:GNAT family N-acetyltransferase [Blastocatellia bacterium]